ncbi:MAG: endonuclease domain-containing protein [Clostridia bacterium]|nr:endonuclease domain-containing protein [Clostridia bacterium]
MNRIKNSKLTLNSQTLRKNMTKEERHLWYDFLKKLPLTVKRQKVFGNYIVDFYISSCKLVIELDGSQHYEDVNAYNDAVRDSYFNKNRITVLRYSNSDVNLNFDGVCSDILNHINHISSIDF